MLSEAPKWKPMDTNIHKKEEIVGHGWFYRFKEDAFYVLKKLYNFFTRCNNFYDNFPYLWVQVILNSVLDQMKQ